MKSQRKDKPDIRLKMSYISRPHIQTHFNDYYINYPIDNFNIINSYKPIKSSTNAEIRLKMSSPHPYDNAFNLINSYLADGSYLKYKIHIPRKNIVNYLINNSKINDNSVHEWVENTRKTKSETPKKDPSEPPSAHAKEQPEEKIPSPSAVAIDQLPEDIEFTGDECEICAHRKANVIIMPCAHDHFCGECIEEWTKESDICPYCRQSIREILQR